MDGEIEPDRVLERAKRDDKFTRLWEGDYSGYPSHSEADMALCCFLAYRTGGNISLMDKLFRQSGLMRPKWDEGRGDKTYGELTLQKALQYVDEVDPYLQQGNDEVTTISNLKPENTATVEAKVTTTKEPQADEIKQAGRLMDQTRAIRFVHWSTENFSKVKLSEDKKYRLENVWVAVYDDKKEVHINEHTAINNLS